MNCVPLVTSLPPRNRPSTQAKSNRDEAQHRIDSLERRTTPEDLETIERITAQIDSAEHAVALAQARVDASLAAKADILDAHVRSYDG